MYEEDMEDGPQLQRLIDRALAKPDAWVVEWDTQHTGTAGGKTVEVTEQRRLPVSDAVVVGRRLAEESGVFKRVTEFIALGHAIAEFGGRLINIRVVGHQRRYKNGDETTRAVLQYVVENPNLTAHDIAKGCFVAYVTALNHLRVLHEEGRVFWSEGGKNGRRRWKVMDGHATR